MDRFPAPNDSPRYKIASIGRSLEDLGQSSASPSDTPSRLLMLVATAALMAIVGWMIAI
jgi:hypothetical protein